jgi:hypothetical protein
MSNKHADSCSVFGIHSTYRLNRFFSSRETVLISEEILTHNLMKRCNDLKNRDFCVRFVFRTGAIRYSCGIRSEKATLE